jgi:hypothetical protein
VVLAILAAIGPQLLPAGWVERVQVRLELVRPELIAVGLAVLVAVAGATVSSQGVAPFIYFRF